MKKLILILFTLLFAILIFTKPAWANIDIEINGKSYECNPRAELINNRLYVPVRFISEALGYRVDWDDEHKIVIIETGNSFIPENIKETRDDLVSIQINNRILSLKPSLGKAYINSSGYTMIPLRGVSEALNANVIWNDGYVIVNNFHYTNHQLNKNYNNNVLLNEDKNDVNSRVSIGEKSELQDEKTGISILGTSTISLTQINNFLAKKELEVRYRAESRGKEFKPFPDNVGYLYLSIGKKYGIRGDVALAQAIKETGYFQYGNEISPEQNNFCGLGATGKEITEADYQKSLFSGIDPLDAQLNIGSYGWSFSTPALGVEAHIQHLFSYASMNALPSNMKLVDPRFRHKNRGVATDWSDLNGKWAVPGKGYGESIVSIWREMK